MLREKSCVWLRLLFTVSVVSYTGVSAQTNLCSTLNCNCTLTNGTNLDITCDPYANLTALPTLSSPTLQSSVTQLRVRSTINGTNGPLIVLPTNICAQYPNLASLDLSFNAIAGFLNTSELACLASGLLSIDLSYNLITSVDRTLFVANSQLQSIDLSHNRLVNMPTVDLTTFFSYSQTITYMDFSFNQIINVDLWPIFVQTGGAMTVDMSNNLITNYTNEVPVSIAMFDSTPYARYFDLSNNQIDSVSDRLLELYGACDTINGTYISFFIVGISNLILTNNNISCDCDSYFLITYIQDNIRAFPQLEFHNASLTQVVCSSPAAMAGQGYVFSNFTSALSCDGYKLPNMTGIFCSLYDNGTDPTIPQPTGWTKKPTTVTTGNTYGNGSTTASGIVTGSNSGGSGSSSASSSPAWYIILGVVLGVALILLSFVLVCYFCRDRILPQRCRSKSKTNDSYESIIRDSDGSSRRTSPLNGTKNRRVSMSTSDNGWDPQAHPEQETQTCFQIDRSKPAGNPLSRPKRGVAAIDSKTALERVQRGRKLSLSNAADMSTNTTNVIRGIPIGTVPPKAPSIFATAVQDTSTSELSVTSIPLVASKRAKLLPQVKSGMYVDTNNVPLLNTSAGALMTSQRQRRRSAAWLRRHNQKAISPLPPRPQSMTTHKTSFDHDGSFDQDLPSIPTIESLADKPPKPMRTVPLLNITVVPAWIGDDDNDSEQN